MMYVHKAQQEWRKGNNATKALTYWESSSRGHYDEI